MSRHYTFGVKFQAATILSRKCSMLFAFSAVIWSRRSGCLVNGQHLLSLNTAALPPHPQQLSSVTIRTCACLPDASGCLLLSGVEVTPENTY